ncbi:hypothetical protein JAAARDRAFT_492659 [Jaapia argillacea MUCL 33604]|uniref:Uncharacterized protein n=1 Tax=Jaapia argillacea MUCL 33604 TaxID=933084 RepID=A0A067PDU2_9AGAM|nr:hypothetical protein JAAARDRAFT_492659 [Jaapia argillacea MUCL 33604]
MAISIAQLCYSSATIYQTRGSQLEQYCYAAFGLSVFPYTFMSLANFICVGLVGEYPTLYLLRTRIMDEAEKRGGLFNGVVGSCREEHEGDGVGESTQDSDWEKFTRVRLSMEVKGRDSESSAWKEGDKNSHEHLGLLNEDGDRSQKVLVVTVDNVTRRFLYHRRGGKALNVFAFEVSSVANQNCIPDGGYVGGISLTKGRSLMGVLLITVLALFILPYIVIFAFSGFEVGRSTVAQRAWMMSWASSGQLSLLSFGLVTLYFPHFSPTAWKEAITTNSYLGRAALLSLILPSVFLLPIPAIGGFITVGKMLKEFGTCSLAPAPCG